MELHNNNVPVVQFPQDEPRPNLSALILRPRVDGSKTDLLFKRQLNVNLVGEKKLTFFDNPTWGLGRTFRGGKPFVSLSHTFLRVLIKSNKISKMRRIIESIITELSVG